MNKTKSPIEIILVVVKKGLSDDVVSHLSTLDINFNLITRAEGTTDNAKAEFFGFGIQEREVVMGCIDAKLIPQALATLVDEFDLNEPYNGLAITIPIKSTTNIVLEKVLGEW